MAAFCRSARSGIVPLCSKFPGRRGPFLRNCYFVVQATFLSSAGYSSSSSAADSARQLKRATTGRPIRGNPNRRGATGGSHPPAPPAPLPRPPRPAPSPSSPSSSSSSSSSLSASAKSDNGAPVSTSPEAKVAVLIDGDNIPYFRVAPILDLLQTLHKEAIGVVKFYYVDHKWDTRMTFQFDTGEIPVSVVPVSGGANAVDQVMSMDAIELCLKQQYSRLCICSNDNDFEYVAVRLKELGAFVYGVTTIRSSYTRMCDETISLGQHTKGDTQLLDWRELFPIPQKGHMRALDFKQTVTNLVKHCFKDPFKWSYGKELHAALTGSSSVPLKSSTDFDISYSTKHSKEVAEKWMKLVQDRHVTDTEIVRMFAMLDPTLGKVMRGRFQQKLLHHTAVHTASDLESVYRPDSAALVIGSPVKENNPFFTNALSATEVRQKGAHFVSFRKRSDLKEALNSLKSEKSGGNGNGQQTTNGVKA